MHLVALVAVSAVDVQHKVLAGYQGWFDTPCSGSGLNSWKHWSRGGAPTADNLVIDVWPNVSEFDDDELCATKLTYAAHKLVSVAWTVYAVCFLRVFGLSVLETR